MLNAEKINIAAMQLKNAGDFKENVLNEMILIDETTNNKTAGYFLR